MPLPSLSLLTYAELQQLQRNIEAEKRLREREGPTSWKCPECSKTFLPSETESCISHLRRTHRYPAEDAATCPVPLYR